MMASSTSPGDFQAGDRVIFHGLVNSTHLNGKRGIVYGYREEQDGRSGRYLIVENSDTADAENNDSDSPSDANSDQEGPNNNTGNDGEEGSSNNGTDDSAAANASTANNAGLNLNATIFAGRPYMSSLAPKNLVLAYPKGTRVVLRGLVGQTHLNGEECTIDDFDSKRCRFIVELHLLPDAGGEKKIMRVNPYNLTHASPYWRPKPVPVLTQELVFSGPMSGIVRLLNHSAYKNSPSTFGNLNDFMQDHRELGLWMAAMEIWTHIMAFDKRGGVAVSTDTASITNEDEEEGSGEAIEAATKEEEGGAAEFPEFCQELSKQPGLTHRICFNPACHKFLPPGTQDKMKRCSRCKAVVYCGKECATADWGCHKKCCKILEKDGVQLADFVTLSSPHREVALASQRMVRLCVNSISTLDNPEEHLAEKANDDSVATLLYRILTEAGGDVSDHILRNLENRPEPGREATIGIRFNSLGGNGIFREVDIQKLANIYDCKVVYQIKEDGTGDDVRQLTAEPNGEEVESHFTSATGVTPGMPPGGLPADVENHLNGMVGEGNWQVMAAGVAAGPGMGTPPMPFPIPPMANVGEGHPMPFPIPPMANVGEGHPMPFPIPPMADVDLGAGHGVMSVAVEVPVHADVPFPMPPADNMNENNE